MYELIKEEYVRQMEGLELIASENYTSRAVMETLASCLTNKYSEGLPGNRYYGGNQVIDKIENLAIKRCLEAFGLNHENWGVNVQPYSGSGANFAVYTGLLKPGDVMMGLDLPSGGHLTHGYQTEKKKISATSIFFTSVAYRVNPKTGYVDYDELEATALRVRPKLIVIGASAYPREWDYRRAREIANKVNCHLMCDMAHIAGLVAGGVVLSPFEYCDIVTTTTHKTLRGPRAGLIFFRRGKKILEYSPQISYSSDENFEYEDALNFAVFPSLQGGPHQNTIAAIAVAMKEVATENFKTYAKNILANCVALASHLIALGYTLVTGGTENHLILIDLRPKGLTGSKIEKLFESINISLNKNAVHGDTSALSPGGIRIGVAAITTRLLQVHDMKAVADFIDSGIKLATEIQNKVGKKLVDFQNEINKNPNVALLAHSVKEFASKFPIPGVELEIN